jgi:hypothetical protein
MALKLRRKRKLALAPALLALMALAACDTQPATNVTSDGATLNAKGACTAGASGTWHYEVMRTDQIPLYWQRVGPKHSFSCASNTGEVAFLSETVRYLAPNNRYPFRLVSQLSDGSVQYWDSNGDNGGTNYDAFTTGPILEEEGTVTDREVGADGTDASAAANGCRRKEFKNERVGKSWPTKTHLWTLVLRTRREYCPGTGQVTKMYAAVPECNMTSAGGAAGYRCTESTKVRANSLGGNPEHVVWTWRWVVKGIDPIFGKTFYTKTWCASNFASGSGAIATNGRCDLVAPDNWRFP